MPFVPNTPESLLSRSDSKNPATTCNGITATGKPCKRTMAISASGSPKSIRVTRNEVVTILSPEHDGQGARAFFCWQHQEQADTPLLVDERSGMKSSTGRLGLRTSIETLADRFGLLELDHDEASPRETDVRQHPKRTRKQEDFPRNQQNVPVPISSSSEKPSDYHPKMRGTKHDHPLTFWLFRCLQPRKPKPTPVPRPKKVTISPQFPKTSSPSHVKPVSPTRPPSTPKRPLQPQIPTSRNQSSQTITPTTNNHTTPDRPLLPRDPSSQTSALLSLIPQTLQPELVADLLRELSKPISPSDLEGFIYMFWLTPFTSPSPSKETTSALLKPSRLSFSSPRPSPHDRRSSDLIRNYTTSSPAAASAAATSSGAERPTIFIKIGRASNVQQRMNQWARQCKHKVTVLRYYPIQSSSVSSSSSSPFPTPQASPISTGSPSPASPPRSPPLKVPYARKVERLIQLELRDSQVDVACDGCGKVHKEWFEVEGSRAEIGRVDEVIKRWVNWSLGGAGD